MKEPNLKMIPAIGRINLCTGCFYSDTLATGCEHLDECHMDGRECIFVNDKVEEHG